MKALHVQVTGKVQGVWFRAWTQEQAEARGLTGWVRNRPDGTVEAVISGGDDVVDALVDALHQGPPAAEVATVRVTATEVITEPGFHIV